MNIALHPRYANSKTIMDSHRVANQNTEVPHKGRTTITQKELAWANQLFDVFLNGSTLKTILGSYRTICESLHLKPNVLPHFYPKLRANLITWRAKALWKKFDLRANNKVYGKGKLCPNTRVLIIGAGPCGLRTAIEAQLLGAKVVVIEKRDRMSRNNVLHLWPFVIDDLRLLGAKKFFGKFCAGAIDHISIRQLQCILLKVALLLGVEVHTEVSFERLVEPNPDEKTGWRAEFKPSDHPVSQYEFDVIIGADGKRNTLQGFRRKEFRGKLAIAITANFINKRTEAEARVEEISGVAFIFNQKFFKDLFAETGIDLENIVYYKDDTHYFVMTAKKASLIEKGVIRQDLPDTAKLLAPENVDREALMNYAREAAEFSTNYNMLNLEFAVNHYGQPDVAMFDFTSMYAAENASRLIERHGYKLLTILVGDSLLEPFWPTGSGCARGFLSSLDAAWAIRAYGSGILSPLEVIAERESIYRLLAQTTPENLNKDYKGYTLDPSTRYPNLNKNLLTAAQVLSLFDTDDPKSIEITKTNLAANHHVVEAPKKRRRRDSNVDSETLVAWIKDQVKAHEDLAMNDITTSLKDGRVLCAIINHYRPDLLDYSAITADDPVRNNKLAFEILEKDIGIPPVMTGEEMANSEVPDYLTMVSYLTHIYDMFRCEIPHIKHPKLINPYDTGFPNLLMSFIKYPENFRADNIDIFELLQDTSDNLENLKGALAETEDAHRSKTPSSINTSDLDLNLTPMKIEDKESSGKCNTSKSLVLLDTNSRDVNIFFSNNNFKHFHESNKHVHSDRSNRNNNDKRMCNNNTNYSSNTFKRNNSEALQGNYINNFDTSQEKYIVQKNANTYHQEKEQITKNKFLMKKLKESAFAKILKNNCEEDKAKINSSKGKEVIINIGTMNENIRKSKINSIESPANEKNCKYNCRTDKFAKINFGIDNYTKIKSTEARSVRIPNVCVNETMNENICENNNMNFVDNENICENNKINFVENKKTIKNNFTKDKMISIEEELTGQICTDEKINKNCNKNIQTNSADKFPYNEICKNNYEKGNDKIICLEKKANENYCKNSKTNSTVLSKNSCAEKIMNEQSNTYSNKNACTEKNCELNNTYSNKNSCAKKRMNEHSNTCSKKARTEQMMNEHSNIHFNKNACAEKMNEHSNTYSKNARAEEIKNEHSNTHFNKNACAQKMNEPRNTCSNKSECAEKIINQNSTTYSNKNVCMEKIINEHRNTYSNKYACAEEMIKEHNNTNFNKNVCAEEIIDEYNDTNANKNAREEGNVNEVIKTNSREKQLSKNTGAVFFGEHSKNKTIVPKISKAEFVEESRILEQMIEKALNQKTPIKRLGVKKMKSPVKIETSSTLTYTDAAVAFSQNPPAQRGTCECCDINKKTLLARKIPKNEINIIISNSAHRTSGVDHCLEIVLSNQDALDAANKNCFRKPKGAQRNNPEDLYKSKVAQLHKSESALRHRTRGDLVYKSGAQRYIKRDDCAFNVNKFIEGYKNKFSLIKMSRSEDTTNNNNVDPLDAFDRINNWLNSSNFDLRSVADSQKTGSLQIDGLTDITSVTRQGRKKDEIVVEHLNDLLTFKSDGSNDVKVVKSKDSKSPSLESIARFLEEFRNPDILARRFSKLSHCPANKLYERRIRSRSEPPGLFAIIAENEESELPEPKHTVSAFTKNHPAIKSVTVQPAAAAPVSHTPHRPSSRHKRHSVDPPPALQKSASNERKPRKRKTMEKFSLTNVEDRMKRLEEIALNRADRHSKRRQQRKMQTDQFIKSMQMLQSNCKPDHSEPFEDYSIFLYRQTAPNFEDRVKDLEKKFTYVPERENRAPSSYNKTTGEKDEDFQARIKGIEDKWSETAHTEKKPKDLLRAIGKIDNSDWNIKEIEKKIHENKLVKVNRDKERVPKWSREQFLARQTKMEKQHLEKQDSTEAKYAEIDKNIKQLDQKLKEGTVRDLKQKKVAMITEKFVSNVEPEPKPVPKSNSKAVIIPTQGNSEACHFCSKKVYLMERLSAEGRFFHRGCFRCQYCHTALRLGSYLYDRDGKYGYRFFCSQHFGMPGELKMPTKVTRKPSQRKDGVSPEKKVLSGVAGVDLLDRVQTPERIEFANLSTGNASSDHDDSLSQMDEDEWTDRNFGASTAELGTSDDDSSSMSDTDSDDEDAFEEALDEPPTKEGTLKWAELFKKRYSKKHRDDSDSEEYSSSDPSSYYENSSGDDDSDTATEGEEEIRARELRKQEVRVEPPVVDTGTDTEVKLNSDSPLALPENDVREKSKSNSPLPESAKLETNPSPQPDGVKTPRNSPRPQSPSSSDGDDDLSDFGSAESDLEAFLREFEQMEKDEQNAKSERNNPNANVNKPQPVSGDQKSHVSKKGGQKLNTLVKSATVSSISPQPVKRNFVLPPKENRKSFGKEFVPAFKAPSPEPILIIKRTPSKINLPKEIKPKVAVKPNLDSATKYFGDASKRKPLFKKPVTANKLTKQVSLPEKPKEEKTLPPAPAPVAQKPAETKSAETKPAGFNFDPIDDDLKDIDDYIENLIMNEEELLKPIDPNKYKLEPQPISSSEKDEQEDDEKISSSIEDLLKALETETNPNEGEEDLINPEGKIEDLLTWMDDLDYQPTTPKIYRSFSDAKYKHLERALKSPERAETVINKLPKDNIKYFEMHLSGKQTPSVVERAENFNLSRSKTEVTCNKAQARRSVDFDAISKVDIKKVLKKFESIDAEEPKRQPPVRPNRKFGKRNSFSNFGKSDDEQKFYASMCTVKTTVNPDFCKDLEINNNNSDKKSSDTDLEMNNNSSDMDLVSNNNVDGKNLVSDNKIDSKHLVMSDNSDEVLITEENLGAGVISAGLVLKAMRDLHMDDFNLKQKIDPSLTGNGNTDSKLTLREIDGLNLKLETPIKPVLSEEEIESTKIMKRDVDNMVNKISDLQKRMNQRSKSPIPDASKRLGGDFFDVGHLKTHLDPGEAHKHETETENPLGFQKNKSKLENHEETSITKTAELQGSESKPKTSLGFHRDEYEHHDSLNKVEQRPLGFHEKEINSDPIKPSSLGFCEINSDHFEEDKTSKSGTEMPLGLSESMKESVVAEALKEVADVEWSFKILLNSSEVLNSEAQTETVEVTQNVPNSIVESATPSFPLKLNVNAENSNLSEQISNSPKSDVENSEKTLLLSHLQTLKMNVVGELEDTDMKQISDSPKSNFEHSEKSLLSHLDTSKMNVFEALDDTGGETTQDEVLKTMDNDVDLQEPIVKIGVQIASQENDEIVALAKDKVNMSDLQENRDVLDSMIDVSNHLEEQKEASSDNLRDDVEILESSDETKIEPNMENALRVIGVAKESLGKQNHLDETSKVENCEDCDVRMKCKDENNIDRNIAEVIIEEDKEKCLENLIESNESLKRKVDEDSLNSKDTEDKLINSTYIEDPLNSKNIEESSPNSNSNLDISLDSTDIREASEISKNIEEESPNSSNINEELIEQSVNSKVIVEESLNSEEELLRSTEIVEESSDSYVHENTERSVEIKVQDEILKLNRVDEELREIDQQLDQNLRKNSAMNSEKLRDNNDEEPNNDENDSSGENLDKNKQPLEDIKKSQADSVILESNQVKSNDQMSKKNEDQENEKQTNNLSDNDRISVKEIHDARVEDEITGIQSEETSRDEVQKPRAEDDLNDQQYIPDEYIGHQSEEVQKDEDILNNSDDIKNPELNSTEKKVSEVFQDAEGNEDVSNCNEDLAKVYNEKKDVSENHEISVGQKSNEDNENTAEESKKSEFNIEDFGCDHERKSNKKDEELLKKNPGEVKKLSSIEDLELNLKNAGDNYKYEEIKILDDNEDMNLQNFSNENKSEEIRKLDDVEDLNLRNVSDENKFKAIQKLDDIEVLNLQNVSDASKCEEINKLDVIGNLNLQNFGDEHMSEHKSEEIKTFDGVEELKLNVQNGDHNCEKTKKFHAIEDLKLNIKSTELSSDLLLEGKLIAENSKEIKNLEDNEDVNLHQQSQENMSQYDKELINQEEVLQVKEMETMNKEINTQNIVQNLNENSKESVKDINEEENAENTNEIEENIVSQNNEMEETKINLKLDEEINPDAFVSLLKSIESEFRTLKEKQNPSGVSKAKKEKPKTNYFGVEEIDTGFSRADERIIDSMIKGLVGPANVQTRRKSSVTANLDAFRVKKLEEEEPKTSAKPKKKNIVKKSEVKDVQAEFDKITKSLFADKKKKCEGEHSGKIGDNSKSVVLQKADFRAEKSVSGLKPGAEEVVTDDVLEEFDKLTKTLLQTSDDNKKSVKVNKPYSSVKKSAKKSDGDKSAAKKSDDDVLSEFDKLTEALLPETKAKFNVNKKCAKDFKKSPQELSKSSVMEKTKKLDPREILDELEVSDDILAEFDKMAASLDVKHTKQNGNKKEIDKRSVVTDKSKKVKQNDSKKEIINKSGVTNKSKPEIAILEKPKGIDKSKSKITITKKPELTDKFKPEIRSLEKPQVTDKSKSEITISEKSGATDKSKPEVDISEKLGLIDKSNSEIVISEKSGVTDKSKSEIAISEKSGVTDKPKPEVGISEKPFVTDKSKPEITMSEKPGVTDTSKPEIGIPERTNKESNTIKNKNEFVKLSQLLEINNDRVKDEPKSEDVSAEFDKLIELDENSDLIKAFDELTKNFEHSRQKEIVEGLTELTNNAVVESIQTETVKDLTEFSKLTEYSEELFETESTGDSSNVENKILSGDLNKSRNESIDLEIINLEKLGITSADSLKQNRNFETENHKSTEKETHGENVKETLIQTSSEEKPTERKEEIEKLIQVKNNDEALEEILIQKSSGSNEERENFSEETLIQKSSESDEKREHSSKETQMQNASESSEKRENSSEETLMQKSSESDEKKENSSAETRIQRASESSERKENTSEETLISKSSESNEKRENPSDKTVKQKSTINIEKGEMLTKVVNNEKAKETVNQKSFQINEEKEKNAVVQEKVIEEKEMLTEVKNEAKLAKTPIRKSSERDEEKVRKSFEKNPNLIKHRKSLETSLIPPKSSKSTFTKSNSVSDDILAEFDRMTESLSAEKISTLASDFEKLQPLAPTRKKRNSKVFSDFKTDVNENVVEPDSNQVEKVYQVENQNVEGNYGKGVLKKDVEDLYAKVKKVGKNDRVKEVGNEMECMVKSTNVDTKENLVETVGTSVELKTKENAIKADEVLKQLKTKENRMQTEEELTHLNSIKTEEVLPKLKLKEHPMNTEEVLTKLKTKQNSIQTEEKLAKLKAIKPEHAVKTTEDLFTTESKTIDKVMKTEEALSQSKIGETSTEMKTEFQNTEGENEIEDFVLIEEMKSTDEDLKDTRVSIEEHYLVKDENSATISKKDIIDSGSKEKKSLKDGGAILKQKTVVTGFVKDVNSATNINHLLKQDNIDSGSKEKTSSEKVGAILKQKTETEGLKKQKSVEAVSECLMPKPQKRSKSLSKQNSSESAALTLQSEIIIPAPKPHLRLRKQISLDIEGSPNSPNLNSDLQKTPAKQKSVDCNYQPVDLETSSDQNFNLIPAKTPNKIEASGLDRKSQPRKSFSKQKSLDHEYNSQTPSIEKSFDHKHNSQSPSKETSFNQASQTNSQPPKSPVVPRRTRKSSEPPPTRPSRHKHENLQVPADVSKKVRSAESSPVLMKKSSSQKGGPLIPPRSKSRSRNSGDNKLTEGSRSKSCMSDLDKREHKNANNKEMECCIQ